MKSPETTSVDDDGLPIRFNSGVVWSHRVKSGNEFGFSNRVVDSGIPFPFGPWQAVHAA